jgi:hypothetical protein
MQPNAHPQTCTDLRLCPACEAPFVQPESWAPLENGHWAVELECPACDWSGAGVYDAEAVERFDRAFDEDIDAMNALLLKLEQEQMAHDAERFAAALHAGAVMPEDF